MRRSSPSVASTIGSPTGRGVARRDPRDSAFRSADAITSLAGTNLSDFASRLTGAPYIGRVDRDAPAQSCSGSTGVVDQRNRSRASSVSTRGDRFSLDTPSGTVTFSVAAVYNDYSSDAGLLLMDLTTFPPALPGYVAHLAGRLCAAGHGSVALRNSIESAACCRCGWDPQNHAGITLARHHDLRSHVCHYVCVVTSSRSPSRCWASFRRCFALVLERRREIGLLR